MRLDLHGRLEAAYASQGLEAQRKAEVYAWFLLAVTAIMSTAWVVFAMLRPAAASTGLLPMLAVTAGGLLLTLRGRLGAAVVLVTAGITVLVVIRALFPETAPPVFRSITHGDLLFRLTFPLLMATLFGTRRIHLAPAALLGVLGLALFHFRFAAERGLAGYGLAWSGALYAILVLLGATVSRLNRRVIRAHVEQSAALEAHTVELEAANRDLEQAQRELQRYREELEQRVEARTQALHEAQEELVRQGRLATLGQIAATVNHELRNPLGAIHNAIYALGDEKVLGDPSRRQRALGIAERNIGRCVRIIGEFLDVSRRPTLRPADVALDALLAELLEELEVPEGVEVSLEGASGLTVRLDPERLRRAMANLLANAIQAVQEREHAPRRVTVSVARSDGRIALAVRDNGPGIPEADRARIFEPLYSTKTYGVGLGLMIVQSIMEEMEGEVTVESEVGAGTTMTLWLPATSPAG